MSADDAALARCLAGGGVALFAADTVYGLCCDPLNPQAVERLFALKGRARSKPAALAFFALEPALAALPELGERTRAALSALLPGPVTLLVPNPAIEVAIKLDCAVLQSSANLAGGRDPRTLAQVPEQIRSGVDLELDRGVLPGTPSTVVDLSRLEATGAWSIVREGARTAADIERALVGSGL
jgi:L-threonylcarbamoyladenylate synthase